MGSGWVWLVVNGIGKITVTSTLKQDKSNYGEKQITL
ncbi:Fe-Mn family superoxide dismutase [Niallia taxi]